MSTVEKMFTADQLEEFVSDLNEWPNSMYGDDDAVHSVSPFTSFYFFYDPKRYIDTSTMMVDIHEAFERMTGQPYKIGTHPDSERPHPYGSNRLPDLREFAKTLKVDKQFIFNVTDEPNHASSPATAGYFWRASDWGNNDSDYSSIHFYYRWQWWQDNQESWRRFVLSVLETLKPQQAYSGFAMPNPLEFGTRSDVATWERSLTTRFYGLDIDDPFSMRGGLLGGIRPPTWSFLLSDAWREKLQMSREEVRAALDDSRIRIYERACGLWIELGEKPGLYPVEDGLPELPMLLTKILRPIRNGDLDLVGIGQWDGDPNERFTRSDAQRWLGRFDEDSDWPSAEERFIAAPALPPADHEPVVAIKPPKEFPTPQPSTTKRQDPPVPRTPGGQPCPQSGWWFTPASQGSRRYFERGQIMPVFEKSTWGETIWQWAQDQSAPKT